jgi:hypothetical protein
MRTASVWTGLVALCALAVTGCGGPSSGTTPPTLADMGAQQILDQARSNAESRSSVHIKGHGVCPQVGQFGADMSLRSDGQATGTITTAAGKARVVTTPTDVYVGAPASFWATQTTPRKVSLIGERWVKFPSTANTCFAALGSFSDVLTNYLDLPGTPVKEKSDKVFGVPAQLLSMPPDVALWIASTGEALPVYVSSESGQLAMTMGEWSADVQVTVPQPSEVVDSAQIATS